MRDRSGDRAAEQAEPEHEMAQEGELRPAEQGAGDALAHLHQRSGHVGQPDRDLAVALEDAVLRAHRHREHAGSGYAEADRVEAGREQQGEGDEGEHGRLALAPGDMAGKRAADDAEHEEPEDRHREQDAAGMAPGELDGEAGGVAAHEGDEEAAEAKEAECVDEAGKARQAEGEADDRPVIAHHGAALRCSMPAPSSARPPAESRRVILIHSGRLFLIQIGMRHMLALGPMLRLHPVPSM